MDGSRQYVFAAGANPPNAEVLQLTDVSRKIRSITVVNYSQLVVNLFPGMETPSGNPALTIGPSQQQTIPLAEVPYIAVSYSGVNNAPGFIYIHYSEQYIAPSASSLVAQSGGSVMWTAQNKITIASGTSINLLALASYANAPGLAQFASLISLAYLHFMGMPATAEWSIDAFNQRTSRLSNYNGIHGQGSSYQQSFATVLPIYNTQTFDNLGDNIEVAFNVLSGVTTGTTLYYSIALLMQ